MKLAPGQLRWASDEDKINNKYQSSNSFFIQLIYWKSRALFMDELLKICKRIAIKNLSLGYASLLLLTKGL